MAERDWYKELKKRIEDIKKCSYIRKDSYCYGISEKIVWCFKWKKITVSQMEELCDEMTKIYKEMEIR